MIIDLWSKHTMKEYVKKKLDESNEKFKKELNEVFTRLSDIENILAKMEKEKK